MPTKRLLPKKTLVAKKVLTARKALGPSSKPKKQTVPTITLLRRKADKLYAFAVRLRDAEYVDGAWQGKCITCERICVVVDAQGKRQKSNGWGHFVDRGCLLLRYNSENVNLQCAHCNAWRDKNSMLTAYEIALDNKYGTGTAAKLTKLKKTTGFKFTREFLEQVIADAKEELSFYEKLGR